MTTFVDTPDSIVGRSAGPVADAAARMPLTCAAAGSSMTLLFDEVDSTNTVARRLILDGGFADGRVGVGMDAGTDGRVDSGVDGQAGVGTGSGADGRVDFGTDARAAVSVSGEHSTPPIPVPATVPVAVVVADRQTAGRGRLDHTWTSRPGESFTVSFVVRIPRVVAADPQVNGWLTMIAGHAALDALRALIPDAPDGSAGGSAADRLRLKWPNDLFCDGRKLGGILTELVVPPASPAAPLADDKPDPPMPEDDVAIVIGIGINLSTPADRLPTPQATSLHLRFPGLLECIDARLAERGGARFSGLSERTQSPAPTIPPHDAGTWAEHPADAGDSCAVPSHDAGAGAEYPTDAGLSSAGIASDVLRDAIAARIVASLRSRLGRFVHDPRGQAAALADETRAVCWTIGRPVEAHFADGSMLRGHAVALNPDASLVVRDVDGGIHVVYTGDVGVLA